MSDRPSSDTREHAIVIGGGVAGLLAARVLADHFAKVTLIERDRAIGREARKGVPQGHHVHGLLAKGQEILAQLFPDLIPALIAGGAVQADMGLDFRWHHHGVWKTRFDSGISVSLFTRPYLEWQIAERVAALPNVHVVSAAVDQLAAAADRNHVIGVRLRPQSGGDAVVLADLIVDATGRGSQMPQWLEAIGYRRPAESTVSVNVSYASRLYRAPAGHRDWKALLISPHAPFKRSAGVFCVEGGRYLVSLAGLHGERPPTDEAGYLDYARSLEVPEVYRTIADAEPLTSIATHRFPTNLRRHYERLQDFPERVLVIGDAFCSFNPIYGQGMTVSALDAMALADMLSEQANRSDDIAGLPGRFHNTISKIVDTPWRLSTGEDFRHAEAIGRRPRGTALLHRYTGQLHRKSACDAALALSFYRVMHMIDPPMALFRPSVVARVLRKYKPPAVDESLDRDSAHSSSKATETARSRGGHRGAIANLLAPAVGPASKSGTAAQSRAAGNPEGSQLS